ncbi:MAG: hypothetical protein ACI9MC_003713 [Kiritimatiellia bacterium]
MIGVATAARAAEHTTCGDLLTEGCHATLAEAVAAAADGDLIYVENGHYSEAITLVDRTLTIEGVALGGARDKLLLGDASTSAAITIRGGDVTLKYLSFLNTVGRGLEVSDGAKVTVEGAMLWSTSLQEDGGLVSVTGSEATFRACVFEAGDSFKRGGHIYADSSDLTLENSRFSSGRSVRGGSVWFHSDSAHHLQIDDCLFELNQTVQSAGAALFISGEVDGGGPTFVVRGSRFVANHAATGGVIHAHHLPSSGTVDSCVFEDNDAVRGAGAIDWHDAYIAKVYRSVFCGNGSARADSTGVVHSYRIDGIEIRNNQFLYNRHTAINFDVALVDGIVANNHFVGNVDLFQPVLNVRTGSSAIFHDNLVAGNQGQSSFAKQIRDGGEVQADHNLWWNNEPVYDGIDEELGDVAADPRLDTFRSGLPCQTIQNPNVRDPAWPSWYGAGRDAGSSRGVDIDGSRIDIGAFGGAEARTIPDWLDEDHDGVPALYDCDVYDETIASGLDDPPYDGVDSDCRGDDDFDGDDDGYRPVEWAADGAGVDCDDGDARRRPGLPELPSNGVDDDCDGWADNTGTLAAGRCAVGSVGGGWILLMLAGALVRRRRGPATGRDGT